MSLDDETIRRLLELRTTTQQPGVSKFPRIEQHGPLRWIDTTMRCANRGCSSPTYCKVEGIPTCMIHALAKLNNMIVDLLELQERSFNALKDTYVETETTYGGG